MDDPEVTFITNMRSLRWARGWSQERLADEVVAQTGTKLHPTAVTKMEWRLDADRQHQGRSLRLNEAQAIAQVLNTDTATLSDDIGAADWDSHLTLSQLQRAGDDLARAAKTAHEALDRLDEWRQSHGQEKH